MRRNTGGHCSPCGDGAILEPPNGRVGALGGHGEHGVQRSANLNGVATRVLREEQDGKAFGLPGFLLADVERARAAQRYEL